MTFVAASIEAGRVFDLVPEKAGYDHDNVFTWLMRASMILAHGRDKHLRFAATEAFFRDAPPSKYAAFGKMLFGLADEASVEPFVTNEKDSCEAAFYLAHKADVAARMAELDLLLRGRLVVADGTVSRRHCVLRIDDASMSTWIFLERGENSASLPVMRSSKRAPMHSMKSQSCIAQLAS